MKETKFVALGLALIFALAAAGGGTEEKVAVAAAENWLGLVDRGDYGASWEQSAVLFKQHVSKEQWSDMVSAVRQPLGKVVSRSLHSSQYATSLPGAPDGAYVVIQFKSSFKNKREAVETVTPMRDPDGDWRVSGYYIR